MSVDSAQGVISHTQTDFADGRDSQNLPGLASSVQDRLMRNELKMTDLLADAGYSNGYNYQFLEKQNIMPAAARMDTNIRYVQARSRRFFLQQRN